MSLTNLLSKQIDKESVEIQNGIIENVIQLLDQNTFVIFLEVVPFIFCVKKKFLKKKSFDN